MPYAQVAGGVVLRYRLSGSGPPLLLIRGLGRSMDYWLELEPLLARDFTVVALDNRGVGGSDAPLPPYTTSAMADDAAKLLVFLGIGPAHVFGISLGGMIAQMLAVRHPYRLQRLVLGCTTAGRSAPRRVAWSSIGRLLGATVMPRPVQQRLVASITLSPGHLARHPETLQRWIELAERWPVPPRGFLGQLTAAALHDAGPALSRIHAPCLVVHGTEDRLIPFENARHLNEQIPGSRLEAVPGAGHDFPAEQPERTARRIRDFLLEK